MRAAFPHPFILRYFIEVMACPISPRAVNYSCCKAIRVKDANENLLRSS